MEVKDLWRKLAQAPDDASVVLITARESKFDDIADVEFSKYSCGKIATVFLIGRSSHNLRKEKK